MHRVLRRLLAPFLIVVLALAGLAGGLSVATTGVLDGFSAWAYLVFLVGFVVMVAIGYFFAWAPTGFTGKYAPYVPGSGPGSRDLRGSDLLFGARYSEYAAGPQPESHDPDIGPFTLGFALVFLGLASLHLALPAAAPWVLVAILAVVAGLLLVDLVRAGPRTA